MQDFGPSQRLEPVEQEPPLLLHSHSVDFHKTSSGYANRWFLNSGLYMLLHAFVFTVTAAVFFILLAWRCFVPSSRRSVSGLRRRRLANGGGQEDDGDGHKLPPECERLEELIAAEQGEDSVSNTPSPQPTGASEGAAAEKERPRKKKQKTKHHAADADDTSEQQAKKARMQEWTMDPLQSLDSLLPSWEEPNPSSSTAPPFSSESVAYDDDLDMLAKLLTTGQTTLVDWIIGSEGDVPLTTEEERRPHDSAYLPPLEGTSRDFVHAAPSHAMEGRGPWEPLKDTGMPSTSGAVLGVQPDFLQPPLPAVSHFSQGPQSTSTLEDSSALPRESFLRPFDQFRASRHHKKGKLSALIRPLELLLRKDPRSEEDMQAIINAAEDLYAFASTYMFKTPEQRQANQMVRVAVHRLIAVSALWRACVVVGSPMRRNMWWADFMGHVYGDAMEWKPLYEKCTQAILLQRVVNALERFSRGEPPKEKELANIMRIVFNRRTGLLTLKGSEWDLLREDDEDS